MRILVVTPAPPRSRSGNRITALRWASIVRELGHHVQVAMAYDRQRCDVMIALHARKSGCSVRDFRERFPDRPLLLALTGTDLYGDIHQSAFAAESLELASRIILLQPGGLSQLSQALQGKCDVIFQSAGFVGRVKPLQRVFEVLVSGHLRPVKDPFRTAMAARRLPDESRIVVHHVGQALTQSMQRLARREMERNSRYRWFGEVTHGRSRRLIARSQVLVLSSRIEGGASVIAEAIISRTPVLASRISNSVGMLGDDYPGFFDYRSTRQLRDLMWRTEQDRSYYRQLQRHCTRLRPLYTRLREKRTWRKLLSSIQNSTDCR